MSFLKIEKLVLTSKFDQGRISSAHTSQSNIKYIQYKIPITIMKTYLRFIEKITQNYNGLRCWENAWWAIEKSKSILGIY